jgi:cytoplasmic iron level regulating protein YaaA (DUF328/UPF0246 family)
LDIVISPAKKLDFESEVSYKCTKPLLTKNTQTLVKELKKCSVKDIKSLMKLSDNLAELNFDRFQTFEKTKDIKPAVFAFVGDTYKGLDISSYSKNNIDYAQDHLHILSGLYGVLRPLDELKPYRLEMGTRFKFGENKNLYDFWGSAITDELNKMINKSKSKFLVNLASEEYFKAVKPELLNAQLVNIKFLENKNGTYKTIGLMAKRARGMMSTYIIKNQVKTVDKLKKFDIDGYKFDAKESSEFNLVFKR